MRRPEVSQSPEMQQQKLDALIVPGKNIGIRHDPKSLREKYNRLTHNRTSIAMSFVLPQVAEGPLSLESTLNVIAAGKLYNQGVAETIIFTTGHTAGKDIPSEARAMKELLQEIYPEIPDSAIICEEESSDTSGNAEEVSKILQQNNFTRVGLLDVGFHLKNARTLFRRYGIKIADQDSFSSEEIVADGAINPNVFPDNYNNTPIVKKERQKELIRSILLNTIDHKGKLLRKVAQLTRK